MKFVCMFLLLFFLSGFYHSLPVWVFVLHAGGFLFGDVGAGRMPKLPSKFESSGLGFWVLGG